MRITNRFEMLVAKILLPAFVYVAVTAILFGNPVQPIFLATVWADRLGIPYWRAIAILCVAISTSVLVRPLCKSIPKKIRPSVFVALAVILSTLFIGLLAEIARYRATIVFKPDKIKERVIFSSIRYAPEDFQLFLHAAALKDCKPYAWSYRTLSFYELRPDIAAHVLPPSWIEQCKITGGSFP